MSEPFIGEIRQMSFNFNPRGWALCNGQLLPIAQNQALFSILGTTYGGDGRVNFALPDLRGRVPVHTGASRSLGERAGVEGVQLNPSEIPQHQHGLMASTTGGDNPIPSILATAGNLYNRPANLVQIGASAPNGPSIGPAGSAPHQNMMPYLVITFCIALVGIFPSRN